MSYQVIHSEEKCKICGSDWLTIVLTRQGGEKPRVIIDCCSKGIAHWGNLNPTKAHSDPPSGPISPDLPRLLGRAIEIALKFYRSNCYENRQCYKEVGFLAELRQMKEFASTDDEEGE